MIEKIKRNIKINSILFAEWLWINCKSYNRNDKTYIYLNTDLNNDEEEVHTIEELYDIFENEKNN
jgi:hypothetical protein